MTIFMVSHVVEFCGRYADRCAMFFDGKIVAIDTPRQFFSGNNFYTTAANRMARHIFKNAICVEEIVELVKENYRISDDTPPKQKETKKEAKKEAKNEAKELLKTSSKKTLFFCKSVFFY